MIEQLKEYNGYKIPDHGDRFPCCENVGVNEIGKRVKDCDYNDCAECICKHSRLLYEYQRFYNPTRNDTPVFAMPEFWLDRLKGFWNGKDGGESNIQAYAYGNWENSRPLWLSYGVYRLAPDWKPEERPKEKAEIGIIIGNLQAELNKLVSRLGKDGGE